jgi:rhamnose transport system substrate-binding protein
MKKAILVGLVVLLAAGRLFANGASEASGSSGASASAKHAYMFKNTGNAFGELLYQGWAKAMTAQGVASGDLINNSPAQPTVEGQIQIIQQFINQRVASITLSANDADALQPILTQAKNAGIKVISTDGGVNPASRDVFVNQTSVALVAQAMLDSVVDMTGGSGDWAILSATSQAANQNAWIAAIESQMNDAKYAGIKAGYKGAVYGDDLPDKSTTETQGLISKYPNIKCIVAITTVGIAQAAKVVTDQGLIGKVKIAGLGLPSEMQAYVKNGSCPYFYLWNMDELGQLCGYTAMALVKGTITGAVGDKFTAGSLGSFTVEKAAGDDGTEIVLGLPFRWDAANVDEWVAKGM